MQQNFLFVGQLKNYFLPEIFLKFPRFNSWILPHQNVLHFFLSKPCFKHAWMLFENFQEIFHLSNVVEKDFLEKNSSPVLNQFKNQKTTLRLQTHNSPTDDNPS